MLLFLFQDKSNFESPFFGFGMNPLINPIVFLIESVIIMTPDHNA